MYPEDIEALYKSVPIGTAVYIVKQPIKVGWLNNMLYVEAHPDLEGEEKTADQRYSSALALIQKANNDELPEFDQVALNQVLKDLDGTPVAIYERLPPLEEDMPATDIDSIAEISKPATANVTKNKKKSDPLVTTGKPTKQTDKTKSQTKTQASKIDTKGKKTNPNVEKKPVKSSPEGYYHGA
jgi:hypothetical protein